MRIAVHDCRPEPGLHHSTSCLVRQYMRRQFPSKVLRRSDVERIALDFGLTPPAVRKLVYREHLLIAGGYGQRRPSALTDRQALLVAELARTPGQLRTSYDLAPALGIPDNADVPNRVSACVCAIRRKFGEDVIVGVPSRGDRQGSHRGGYMLREGWERAI